MFVQIIEGRTNDPKALMEQGDAWQRDVRPGAIGYLGVTAGVTADGRTVAIVRFEDEASARANSERPEQAAVDRELRHRGGSATTAIPPSPSRATRRSGSAAAPTPPASSRS